MFQRNLAVTKEVEGTVFVFCYFRRCRASCLDIIKPVDIGRGPWYHSEKRICRDKIV